MAVGSIFLWVNTVNLFMEHDGTLLEFLGMNIQPLECCLGVWLPESRHQGLTHDPSYYFDGPQKDERKKHHEDWEDSSFYRFWDSSAEDSPLNRNH